VPSNNCCYSFPHPPQDGVLGDRSITVMESAIEAGRTEPAFFTAALLWWFELARSQSTWEIGERRREPQSS